MKKKRAKLTLLASLRSAWTVSMRLPRLVLLFVYHVAFDNKALIVRASNLVFLYHSEPLSCGFWQIEPYHGRKTLHRPWTHDTLSWRRETFSPTIAHSSLHKLWIGWAHIRGDLREWFPPFAVTRWFSFWDRHTFGVPLLWLFLLFHRALVAVALDYYPVLVYLFSAVSRLSTLWGMA